MFRWGHCSMFSRCRSWMRLSGENIPREILPPTEFPIWRSVWMQPGDLRIFPDQCHRRLLGLEWIWIECVLRLQWIGDPRPPHRQRTCWWLSWKHFGRLNAMNPIRMSPVSRNWFAVRPPHPPQLPAGLAAPGRIHRPQIRRERQTRPTRQSGSGS